MAIIKGAINPVISGTTTFPESKAIQVTAPNRHSVRPSLVLDFANSKTLDPRITFTRGSSATYYDGSTALAEQNLLASSQAFNSAPWAQARATIVDNVAVAPDGTTTATSITQVATGTYGCPYRGLALPINRYTISVYAKAGTASTIIVGDESAIMVWFNLSAGTIGTTTQGAGVNGSSTITSIGNGWYRCTVTGTYATSQTIFAIASGDNTTVATGGTSIYVWGAQFETRSAATAYTATTTNPISNYIPVLKSAGANQPRFDVDPITQESKGLLIEEQRTNIVSYSDQFNQWSLYQAGSGTTPVVTTNAAIAPDGSLTADAVSYYAPSSGDQSSLYTNFVSTTTGSWTGSLWAKALTAADVGKIIGFRHVGGSTYTLVTLTSSWVRVSSTETQTSSPSSFEIVLRPAVNTSTGTVRVALWGAQVEVGNFATSYIPTAGASATRAADLAEISGQNFQNFFNASSGTFYFEGSINGTPNVGASMQGAFAATRDTGNVNVIDLRAQQTNLGSLSVLYGYGATQAQIGNAITATPKVNMKFGVAYATNDAVLYKDGVQVGSDSSVVVPTGLTKLEIGKGDNDANKVLNGYIRKLSYYPTRLTNNEIVSLTAA